MTGLLTLAAAWLAADQIPAGYVPAAQAKTVALRPAAGNGQAPYLGIAASPNAAGALAATTVEPGSPAEAAGLRAGDVLATLDGKPVGRREDFRDRVQAKAPGDRVALGLLRDGKPVSANATLAAASRPMSPAADTRPVIGVRLAEPKAGEPGVRLDAVTPGMPAAAAGLQAGDQLLAVDGKPLTPELPFASALGAKQVGEEIVVLVRRAALQTAYRMKLARTVPVRGQQGPMETPLWRKPRLRLAVLGIEFPDVKREAAAPADLWPRTFFAPLPANLPADATPSLAAYFQRESYGKLAIEGKFLGWTLVSKPRGEYSQGSGTSNLAGLPAEAMEKLLAQPGQAEALNDFDALAFVYAGAQVRTNQGSVYAPRHGQLFVKRKLWPYVFVAEGGAKPNTAAGIARPFARMLGLPSLAARSDAPGAESVGPWCLLGDRPREPLPRLSAWAKDQLGWLEPAAVDPLERQRLVLLPVERDAKQCVKVLARPDGSEHFLLENRGGGLLVWRVVDGRPLLEEAHGVAGPNGPYVLPEHVPYPAPQNDAFTPDTTPASRAVHGAGLPVRIAEIRRLDGGAVGFRIGYDIL